MNSTGNNRNKTRKNKKQNTSGISLYYMARPVYGGWVSFTAHLSLKHDLPVYKLASRTEKKGDGSPTLREFGYGVKYQNRAADDLPPTSKHLITAIDKTNYKYLKDFPDGTMIVIHDPTEVNSKAAAPLVAELRRFKIITIRKSVQEYLLKTLHLKSKFLLHPFYPYRFDKEEKPSDCVSISRIDFDKHTDILLKANKQLTKPILIYGAHNRLYVHFKLEGLNFKKYYKGGFEKSFEQLSKILENAKYVVDMSVIKHDGGGTQYTFLEAIHQECALIINEKWVANWETPFVHKKNCFVVKDEHDLVRLLQNEDPPVENINKEAKKILEPHIQIDWLRELQKL